MNKENLRIVYMGTPDFAVESLRTLVDNGYNVVGVVTMPDKPIGRGHQINYSAVKHYALYKDLPLLQPTNLKDESFLEELRALKADLQIVVAFRMLPEVVWNMPRLGTFNLHASLLPQYRGAAPINWAIINGEKETGITTFFLQHEIDTGKVIHQEKVDITEEDNAETLHDKLMMLGAELVKKTVDDIINDKVQPVEQSQMADESQLKPAPKIFKETCKINWDDTVDNVYNFVRGLSPYPTPWAELTYENGTKMNVKIYECKKEYIEHSKSAGSIDTDGKTYLKVAVKNGYIHILSMQLPNKKQLDIESLLRGFAMNNNFSF